MISELSLSMILIPDSLNDHLYRFSADRLMIDNQTNLAIKGIIAIKAMSKMSSIVSQASDVDKYSVRAGLLHDA
jgi:hypothetical protein